MRLKTAPTLKNGSTHAPNAPKNGSGSKKRLHARTKCALLCGLDDPFRTRTRQPHPDSSGSVFEKLEHKVQSSGAQSGAQRGAKSATKWGDIEPNGAEIGQKLGRNWAEIGQKSLT